MINVLNVLLPVIVMLGIGMWLKKSKLVSRAGIQDMKFLTTKIMLPVAIFNALATTKFSSESFIMIAIMFVMLVVSFLLGYLMKPAMPEPYKKYVPFMVSVYEGGMMGYPLYTTLVGAENISNIALIDIAGLIFGFSIYMSLLTQTEKGEKLDAKQMVTDAAKNPTFVATVLGLVAGLLGPIHLLQNSPVGVAYDSVISIITTPMSAVILIVVGYEIEPVRRLIRPCLRTIVLRVILQAVMIAGVLVATHYLVGQNTLMDLAIIMYMSSPATFSMQGFLQTKDGSEYASTTNSLYCFVSIAVYAVMAGIYL